MENQIRGQLIKTTCSLESGQVLQEGVAKSGHALERGAFQRYINLDAQKQWTGLAEGKDKSFTKEDICMGHDCLP